MMYIVDTLEYWLTTPRTLQMMAYGLVGVLCVVWIILTISKMKFRGWEGKFYIVLCGILALFSLCEMLWFAFPATSQVALQLSFYSAILFMALPGGLYLHVGSQLSPKRTRLPSILIVFGVPLLAGVLLHMRALEQGYAAVLGLPQTRIAILAWCGGVLLAAVFRCMKVLYRVPRHMQKSTYYLLAGIVFMALFAVLHVLDIAYWSSFGGVLCVLLSMALTYIAFKKVFSFNVIVTSQEFVTENLSTYILVLSRGQRVLDWNKKSPGAFAPLPTPIYMETFEEYRQRFIGEGRGNSIGGETQNVVTTMQDGMEKHYLIVVHPVEEGGRTFGHVAEISEVTQLYAALRQLDDIAMLDQLTGLASRNAYVKEVKNSVVPENMPMMVMVGDVNGLKVINDTQGHVAGDGLLKAVGDVIQLYLPFGAFAARIGGDEFTVLLPQGTEEQTLQFVEKVNRACAAIHDPLYGTPSIAWGYAQMRSAAEDYNDVFKEADGMMYAQKRKHFVFRSRGLVESAAAAGTAAPAPSPSPPPQAEVPAPPQAAPLALPAEEEEPQLHGEDGEAT